MLNFIFRAVQKSDDIGFVTDYYKNRDYYAENYKLSRRIKNPSEYRDECGGNS